MSLSYRQLQSALKTAKANGIKVTVKLNSKQQVLQAEYDRIRAATVQEFATKVQEQQEPAPTQQNAEVEQLKQELAEAQAKIQEQQETIAKLEQELEAAKAEEQQQYSNYCDYEEPQPEQEFPKVETDELTPEKAEALDINGKLIWDTMEYLGKHGKKATIQWLKQMSPKFHSDTCHTFGNKFNIWQWQGYMNIITMVKNDELESR